ncbi:hypothetical protein EV421DRAFT_2022507 [Armillaria borealis]|uniref:Uncharacterized protein n=1 Tax=Armillaria borealis TaxID=47425 RepID=A0AA39MJ44_9AGAR|nr:hypothetical protein EV421DRAFT_2022507 [Armillaria borealis]
MVYQTSENKIKAASGLVICNYDGYKVTNTNLLPSNITSPREMEDWEVPVSEIRSWTYTLIEVFGFETVVAFRNRAIESPLDERGALLLACEGEVLRQRNHAAVSDRVTAWRNNVAVVLSHAPPIHPFDSHRRVFSFLYDEPYTPGEAPDNAPTLDIREYDRWFLLTLLGKPRYDDRKASEEQKILWRLVHHDPHTEPDDWEDFLRSKRDDRIQHHRASRDEPKNTIDDNTASISPSGVDDDDAKPVVPSASVTPPAASIPISISDVAASDSYLACGIPSLVRSATDGLVLIAVYEQQRRIQASDVKRLMVMASCRPFDRTMRKMSCHRSVSLAPSLLATFALLMIKENSPSSGLDSIPLVEKRQISSEKAYMLAICRLEMITRVSLDLTIRGSRAQSEIQRRLSQDLVPPGSHRYS